jgi:hypothetical protein
LQQLNRYAEQWLNQQLKQIALGDWYVGRPVMMTYNDYQLGISNGDIGICFKHRSQSQQFEVYFPSLDKWIAAHRLPRNMQTAFALTIHKSQGSEFTHTAIVLDAPAEKLLSQELIYTAVTRAKKVVSILADSGTLQQATTSSPTPQWKTSSCKSTPCALSWGFTKFRISACGTADAATLSTTSAACAPRARVARAIAEIVFFNMTNDFLRQ